MDSKMLEKLASVLEKHAASDPKEQELWRLVNGLKKRGINLSEKSIFELKKKKGIPLPPGDLADEVNAETIAKPKKPKKPIEDQVEKVAGAYDPYSRKSLGDRAQVEKARINLAQRRNVVLSALLGGGLGSLLGAAAGAHYNPSKETFGRSVGLGTAGGVVGGAALGGLSAAAINELLYGGYEKDLDDISNKITTKPTIIQG